MKDPDKYHSLGAALPAAPQPEISREVADRLHREFRARYPEPTPMWYDKISSTPIDWDATMRAIQAQTRAQRQVNKPLHEYTDAELIMEMIGRGYAAMKLPENGGPPEALKDT